MSKIGGCIWEKIFLESYGDDGGNYRVNFARFVNCGPKGLLGLATQLRHAWNERHNLTQAAAKYLRPGASALERKAFATFVREQLAPADGNFTTVIVDFLEDY